MDDVTERRRAEETLKESEERFRRLVEQAADAVFVHDLSGRIMDVNRQACESLDYTQEELLEMNVSDIEINFKPDALENLWEDIRRGDPVTVEGQHRRKDGSTFPVEARVGLFESEGRQLMLALVRDVTERKKAEEEIRHLNEDLERRVAERTRQLETYAERLEQSNRELQDFAYVASHDLQEPLRKIRAFSGRLAARYEEALDEQGLDYLDRMEGAAARMQNLVEDLLELSRVTTRARPFEMVDLGEVAAEAISDLDARIEEGGGRVELLGELPTVEADRAQMRQLLQNLIGNALKFHKDTLPVVRVWAETGADQTESCEIFVEDNGIGFDEEHLERIFLPFQRLHGRSDYEGTGMGLAICRKVVERHGGSITAKSTPGQGSTFVVTLPVRQPAEVGEENGEKVDHYAAFGR